MLFLSYCNKSWIFSTDFRKILKYKISWIFDQWEPFCSMRKDRQTDMTKVLVASRNFENAHKKDIQILLRQLRMKKRHDGPKPSFIFRLDGDDCWTDGVKFCREKQHNHKHNLYMIHFMCVKHYKLRGNKSLREGILRLTLWPWKWTFK